MLLGPVYQFIVDPDPEIPPDADKDIVVLGQVIEGADKIGEVDMLNEGMVDVADVTQLLASVTVTE